MYYIWQKKEADLLRNLRSLSVVEGDCGRVEMHKHPRDAAKAVVAERRSAARETGFQFRKSVQIVRR